MLIYSANQGTSFYMTLTSIMETVKQEIKNGTVMLAHVECAKRPVKMPNLLTKNCNAFFSRTPLL